MRSWIGPALVMLSAQAFAQAPDCRVLLNGVGTAQHQGEITMLPSAAGTLEAHCTGTSQRTFRWSTGATTFAIVTTAPGTAGSQQLYSVEVTQGGNTATFTGTIRSAAAGSPVCALTRDPPGDVPVFTAVRISSACTGSPSSHRWTGGYDLRDERTPSALHVNLVNEAGTIPIDLTASNQFGEGAVASIGVRYVVSPPSCRIVASPAGRVAPNQAVTLTAECDGAPTAFNWAHGASGQSIVVNPAIVAAYTLRAANGAGVGAPATHTVPVSSTAPGLRDFTGHWWGGQAENGWGMTLNQHGQALFGVLYYYDVTGEPTWSVMPGGVWNGDFTVFTGDLYTPTGTFFGNYDASQLVAGAPTGTMTLTFASPTQVTAAYRMAYSQFDPVGRPPTTFGQKSLVPLILNSGTNPSGINVADMWWGGAAQNGWGISINQRSSEIFAAWFTYGVFGRPTWFIISGSTWSGNTLSSASVFRVTGSPWLGVPFNATAVQPLNAGPASVTFNTPAIGSFNYNVNGTAGSKLILRQEF